MNDNELFSSNFEAFSDDLKNSLSNKEFKREVMAAIKTAPSSTELNFNFIGLNASGKSAGLLRAILSLCFKSISFQVPELKFVRTTGTKYKLVIIKVKRFLSLKFETKLTIREKIYTIISSERMTSISSIAPVVNIFAMLATRITKVDKERDQNKANLVWKLEEEAPKIFNIKWSINPRIYMNIGRKKRYETTTAVITDR